MRSPQRLIFGEHESDFLDQLDGDGEDELPADGPEEEGE
jgi:hypothetical protein